MAEPTIEPIDAPPPPTGGGYASWSKNKKMAVFGIGGLIVGVAVYLYAKNKSSSSTSTTTSGSAGTTSAPTELVTPTNSGSGVAGSTGGDGGTYGGNGGGLSDLTTALAALITQNESNIAGSTAATNPVSSSGSTASPAASSNTVTFGGNTWTNTTGNTWVNQLGQIIYGYAPDANNPYGRDANGVPLQSSSAWSNGSSTSSVVPNTSQATAAPSVPRPSWASTSFLNPQSNIQYYGLGNPSDVQQAEKAGYKITTAQAAGVPGGTTKAEYAYK